MDDHGQLQVGGPNGIRVRSIIPSNHSQLSADTRPSSHSNASQIPSAVPLLNQTLREWGLAGTTLSKAVRFVGSIPLIIAVGLCVSYGSWLGVGGGAALIAFASLSVMTAFYGARVLDRKLALRDALESEQQILSIASQRDGLLTVPDTAQALGCSLNEAQQKLDQLAKDSHAELDVQHDGQLQYRFPALSTKATDRL